MKRKNDDSALVYTTGEGTICAECGKSETKCICRAIAKAKVAKTDGTVRIAREKKGRGGKTVTVVSGVPLPAGELDKLARSLRKKCGCGGTVKDGMIELQGDRRDMLVEELTRAGYRVKKSGG